MAHSLTFSSSPEKPFVGALGEEVDSSKLAVQLAVFSYALDQMRDNKVVPGERVVTRHWSNDGVAFDPAAELGTSEYAVYYVPSVAGLARAVSELCSSARVVNCYYVALTAQKAVATAYMPVSRSVRFLHLLAATSDERVAWNQYNDYTQGSEAVRVMQARVLSALPWAAARRAADEGGSGYLCHTDLNFSPEDSRVHESASSQLAGLLPFYAQLVARAASLKSSSGDKLPQLRYDNTHVPIREAGPEGELVAKPMRVRVRSIPDVERVVRATLEAARPGAHDGKHPGFFYNNALVINPGKGEKVGTSYLSFISTIRSTRDGAGSVSSSIPVREPVRASVSPESAAEMLGFSIDLSVGEEIKKKSAKPRSRSKPATDSVAGSQPKPRRKRPEPEPEPVPAIEVDGIFAAGGDDELLNVMLASPAPAEEEEEDEEEEPELVPIVRGAPPAKRARTVAAAPKPPPATGKAGVARAALAKMRAAANAKSQRALKAAERKAAKDAAARAARAAGDDEEESDDEESEEEEE